MGRAWMLSGDRTVAAIADVGHTTFSTAKVWFDVAFVALAAGLTFCFFGHLTGNGHNVVIREGTLLLAALTGLCMKVTDPIINRLLGRTGW